MSTWVSQYVFYGTKVKCEEYKKIEDALEEQGISSACDILNAANNEHGMGWLDDGSVSEFYLVGKIVMYGEETGNDNLLGAQSGIMSLGVLNQKQRKEVQAYVDEQLGRHEPCQYFVACIYC